MFAHLENGDRVVEARPEAAEVDVMIDDVFRAALCLTCDEDAAAELTERAVSDALAGRTFDVRAPSLPPLLRALATISATLPEPPVGGPAAGRVEPAAAAFRILPREVRLPAIFYFTQTLTSRQVAAVLDTTVQSVRARLSLARRLLADALVLA